MGQKIVRKERPPWKPGKGQRVRIWFLGWHSVSEYTAFTLSMILAAALIAAAIWYPQVLDWLRSLH